MCQLWRLDESGAGATVRYAPGRAAHVDVDAVKPELAEQDCHLAKVIRRPAKYLSHNRALGFVIAEVLQQPAIASKRTGDAGKLRIEHGGPTVLFLNVAKRVVGDAVHRRQAENGARERRPK